MRYELNRDIKKRDEILFGRYDPQAYMGGIRRFQDLQPSVLNRLIDEGFVNIDDAQNSSPTIEELLDFAERFPGFYTFDGYVVSDKRSDYRLSIDSIRRTPAYIDDREELLQFVDLARYADEANFGAGDAWWD